MSSKYKYEVPQNFATVFNPYEDRSGKTARLIAELAEIKETHYCEMKAGKRKPSRFHLYKICLTLKLTPEEAISVFHNYEGAWDLQSSDLFDVIFLNFLDQKNYSIDEFKSILRSSYKDLRSPQKQNTKRHIELPFNEQNHNR